MANLYSPLVQRLQLFGEIAEAEGVLTDEMVERLTISDERIAEGALQLLELRQTGLTQIMGFDAEMERLKALKASAQRVVDALERQLLDATKRLGPIKAGSYTVTTSPSDAAIIEDEDLLPARYLRIIPAVAESTAPDKAAIKKALKNNEVVPGAILEMRQNLRIK